MRPISEAFNPANGRSVRNLHEVLRYVLDAPVELDSGREGLGERTATALARALGREAPVRALDEAAIAELNRRLVARRARDPDALRTLYGTMATVAKARKIDAPLDPAEAERGRLGPSATAFLKRFQAKYRLPETGELDVATHEKLRAIATGIAGSKPRPKAVLKVRRPEKLRGVVNYLRLNMSGERVRDLQTGLSWLGHPILAGEHEAGRFGRTTRDALEAFQGSAGLQITGAVDGPTARALNARLMADSPTVAKTLKHRVRGSVRDANWRGVPRARLRLSVLGSGKVLVERPTFANGFFDIVYDPQEAASAAGVQLVVERLGDDGAVVARKTLHNARRVAWANFTEGDAPYRGPSRFEELARALRPVAAQLGIAFEAFEESERRRDVSFAARATKLPPQRIMRFLLAHRVATRMGGRFEPAVLFAFFERDLPPELPGDLLPVDLAEWDVFIAEVVEDVSAGIAFLPAPIQAETVDSALADNIVPRPFREASGAVKASLAEAQVDAALNSPLLAGDGTLGRILNLSGLPADRQRRVARRFVDSGGLNDPFWDTLPAEGLSEAEIATVRRVVDLSVIARNHAPMVDHLMRGRAPNGAPADPRGLAKLDRAAWRDMIVRETIAPPPFADARDDAERVDMYAAALKDQAERLFPDVAMLASVERRGAALDHVPAVARFVDDHPDFDLAGDNLAKANRAVGNAMSDAELAVARVLQRVRRVSPSAEGAAALVEARLLSASELVRHGESDVHTRLEPLGVSREETKWIMRRAETRHAQVLAKFSQYHAAFMQASPEVLPKFVYAEEEVQALVQDSPDLEALLGSLDYCDCPPALSLYSPAAYLSDLLRFLGTKPAVAVGTSVFDVLDERRPDIRKIKLNEANTFTPLPMLDLINEVLEHMVPPAARDFALATTRTAEELDAAPEHVRVAAYEHLRTQRFPMFRPFNLWRAETRAFLSSLQTPRYEIMRTLAAAPGTAAQVPSAAEIAAEAFAISPRELAMLAPAAPENTAADQDVYFGFDITRDRVPVGEFMRKAALSYTDVLALLDTRFANPLIQPIGIDRPADDCDVERQSLTNLTEARFDRIHRFLRLWRHTPFAMWELDLALMADAVGGATTSADSLGRLGALKRVQARLGLPVDTLLAFFGPLDTRTRISTDGTARPVAPLFDTVFLDALTSPADAGLPHPFARPLVAGPLDARRTELGAALNAGPRDLDTLLPLTNGQISDESLAILYRWTSLARALLARVTDLLALKALTGQGATFADPAAVERFVERWDEVREAGLDVATLHYILRAAPESHLGLRDEVVALAVDDLRRRLAQLKDDLAGAGRSGRETLDDRLRRFPPLAEKATRDRALDLVDALWTGTEAERIAFVNATFATFAGGVDVAAALPPRPAFHDGDALTEAEETEIEGRRAFVLGLVYAFEAPLVAVEWASARAEVDNPSARLLLERMTLADARPAMAHLLDEALVARDAGGTFTTPATRAALPDLFALVVRLHKAGLMLRRSEMDAAALAWLLDNAGAIGALSPLDLPVGADPAQPLIDRWSAFAALVAFRKAFPAPEGVTLFAAIDEAGRAAAIADDVEALLAALVQRPAADLAALRALLALEHGADPALQRDYRRPRTYARIARALDIARRVRVPFDTLASFARVEAEADERRVARAAREAARGELDRPSWLRRLKSVEDPMRERKRDALADYLVERSQRTVPARILVDGQEFDNPAHMRSRADLTRFVLLDVEMTSCQPSSRVRQAILSVQTFVNRCLRNKEAAFVRVPRNDPDLVNNWEQWRWRRSYRLWEANRKVFFYPENWIEPQLRDDKTPFFVELENEILQGELTAETAESAYRNYLEKLREVANLEVVGVHQELPSPHSRLHVVARTKDEPARHYYRMFDFDYDTWSPWERIDTDVKGRHALPVIYNRKLYVFWLEFDRKPEKIHRNPPATGSNTTRKNPRPGEVLEIHLGWSERTPDGWASRRISTDPLIHPWSRPDYAYQLRPRYKPADNTLWIDVFVCTTPEFNDTRFLEPGKAQYSHDYRTSTRFSQLYRPWHSSSFVFDGTVRQIKLKGIDAWYYFAEEEALRYVSSHSFVRNNFDEEGRRIEPLLFPDRRGSAPLPPGMHYEYNALANNDIHYVNSRRMTVNAGAFGTRTLLENADHPFRVIAPPHAVDRPSMFYRDRSRSFFVKAEWRYRMIDYRTRVTQDFYSFYPFHHPYADLFLRELNRGGLDGLLNRPIQTEPETFYPGNTFAFASYQPVSPHRAAAPAERDVVDFSFSGAYAVYNWELFFHAPFYIAIQLVQNLRFDDAFDWFHRIFDPTSTDDLPVPQRYWITKPFYEHSSNDYRIQRIVHIVQNIDEFRDAITAWANQPFKPHLVARYRLVAYQRAVVMRYLDALIAQGDNLFARETMEAINEAALYYQLAADLVGDRPIRVPAIPHADKSFEELEAEGGLDLLGNASVLAQIDNAIGPSETLLPPGATPPPVGDVEVSYFCLPPNDRLFGYWEVVEQRLEYIRTCRSLAGVERTLALFAPPIDPALLVKAVAAGMDLASAVSRLSAPGPQYRFVSLVRLAKQTCADVQRLGEKVLAALEKRDAEALSRLRASHAVVLRERSRDVLAARIRDAEAEIDALRASKRLATERRTFYADRTRINALEGAALGLGWGSTAIEAVIATGYILAGGLALVPSFIIGGSGFGGSPHAVTNVFDGEKMSYSAEHAVNALSAISRTLEKTAGQLRTTSDYMRRAEEWDHQVSLAMLEENQVDGRIDQAAIRAEIARSEADNLEKDIEDLEAEAEYLSDKFTNEALYEWMIGQLGTLYFGLYRLAHQQAVQAERAFAQEIGDPAPGFVSFGHWDSLKRGLLAGDRLNVELSRMEGAWYESHKREFEITKHVSLARFAPLALLQLRFTGTCEVELPEWLFDLDFPQHYFRRLKTVGLSVPAVAGPYTGINCTLTLVSSTVRVDPLVGGGYAQTQGDTRFRTEFGATSTIATSRGQEDAGLFTLNFEDPRPLPFEYAGAISRWVLTMRPENNQFDFATMSDVVMHLRYTARDGGENHRIAAQAHVDGLLPNVGVFMTSLMRDHADAWTRFVRPAAGGENEIVVTLARDRFPFFVRNRTIRATSAEIIVVGTHAGSYDVRLRPPQQPAAVVQADADQDLGGIHRASDAMANRPNADGEWRIAVRRTNAGDFRSLSEGEVSEVIFLMTFDLQ